MASIENPRLELETPTWFAFDESRPLAFFAGIHWTAWHSKRGSKSNPDALTLQRPLSDGTLKIVAQGEKEDPIAA